MNQKTMTSMGAAAVVLAAAAITMDASRDSGHTLRELPAHRALDAFRPDERVVRRHDVK